MSTFSLLLLLAFTSGAQTKYKLDSLVYYAQDSLGNNYRSAKNAYTYDANGDCIEDQGYYLNNNTGKWSIGSRTTFYFDNRHNDTLTVYSSWSEEKNTWVYYNKQSETYDANNRRTSMTQYNLDPITSKWIRVWRREYTYDQADRLIQEIQQDSSGSTGLKNTYKKVYEFTPTANRLYWYNWSNGAWKVSTLEESTLDANGNAILTINYSLKYGTEANPVWENSAKTERKFNANNDAIESYDYNWQPKTWLGNDYQWIPFSSLQLTNDAFHNLIAWVNSGWNKTTLQYDTQYRVERTYNTTISYQNLCIPRSFSNDNLPSPDFMYMQLESRFYGWVNNAWKEYIPNKYYYTPIVITDMETPVSNNIKDFVYPNPMLDVLHVQGKAELIDMMGNTLTEGENLLPVSNLPKGVYLVKTQWGNTKVLKE